MPDTTILARIKSYLADVSAQWRTGEAREHAYRPALAALLSDLIPRVTVVNEPAHVACGAPDLLVRSNGATHAPVGYVETKDIGDGDLDGNGKNREQFDRYKCDLDNLVFTDYLDFRFHASTSTPDVPSDEAIRIAEIVGGKIVPAPDAALQRFAALLAHFGAATPRRITSPARLASLMAGKARLLAQAISAALAADTDGSSPLAQQRETFRKMLIHDLTSDSFADIYAQTITYGLFAARLHDATPEDFSRAEAATLLPRTNPLLRKMFLDLAADLDPSVEWIVDDLVALFAATDLAKLLKDYGKSTEQTDPILHFYEDFLAAYNPALRKQRGVWYTPDPVVGFIVRAVDRTLQTAFDLPDGLADCSKTMVEVKNDAAVSKRDRPTLSREMHRVQVLDPAAGTGTFLATTIKHIHAKFANMEGQWPGYVRDHLLPRLNGFEILMASYAMAHLKIDQLLASTGYVHETNERLRVFLTNSLEECDESTGTLWAAVLAQEAQEANYIKRDCPVMVVMGNPPYSGESQNKGDWIMRLMEDYKKEPGGIEKLKERNPKWINDDYVKFLRLAEAYVERNGQGVVAFINPHGFLDNPTFRGMRWNLLKTFDEIYVLNLHGNAKKKETCPDGSKDENVFDIMQGVSINIFVKRGNDFNTEAQSHRDGRAGSMNPPLARVFYTDLYGTREQKYAFLESHSLADAGYKEVTPTAPMYFFVPKNTEGEEEYRKGFSIAELCPVNSMGVTTGNDAVLVSGCRQELLQKVRKCFSIEPDEGKIREFSYRPFDQTYVYYDPSLMARAREKFMSRLNDDSLSLTLLRIASKESNCPALAAKGLIDKTILSSKDNANVFPLYLYTESMGTKERRANLNPEIVAKIAAIVQPSTSNLQPEDIFHYVYAVLHTPSYRARYREFLKVDFPRIPYPTSDAEFRRLAAIGAELVAVHLLKAPSVRQTFSPVATFPIAGDNRVEKVEKRDGENSTVDLDLHSRPSSIRVYINASQYFDNVPETAYNAFIGGYQPAQKWLKDRKGRVLSYDDTIHYKSIILALLETARLMDQLENG